jgi:hypothetical protein
MAMSLLFPRLNSTLSVKFARKIPLPENWAVACYFVDNFPFFRLERRHGSCNVYQSVKLSFRCRTKATADSSGQEKRQPLRC